MELYKVKEFNDSLFAIVTGDNGTKENKLKNLTPSVDVFAVKYEPIVTNSN